MRIAGWGRELGEGGGRYGGWEMVKEGDLTWSGEHTISIQIMYYGIMPLKPV